MKTMISIIICTYNKAKYLDLTLSGYQAQTYKDFEIVVVDDGSIDNTKDIINKYNDRLKIKYHKQENRGIAASRNAALNIAEGKYIIITDDDRIPSKDFVYQHKSTLDKNGKVVSIGKQGEMLSIYCVGLAFDFTFEMNIYNRYPFLLSVDEFQFFTAENVVDNFPGILEKYFLYDCEDNLFARMLGSYGSNLSNCGLAWSQAYGGNIAYNRNYLKYEISYDEYYKGYGCEDIDFSYQLYLSGYEFRLTENAVNYHQLHKRSINQIREQFNNFNYFFSKYQHLEVYLVKMYWQNIIYFEPANNLLAQLKDNKGALMPLINEYIKRIKTSTDY